jgi:acetyl-CoA carboxylase biotin carboxyl carrier protein
MSESSRGGGDIFDLDRIRRLVELMKEHDLSEVDLQQDDQKIRLARGGAAPVMMAASHPTVPAVASTTSGGAPVAPSATEGDHIVTIKSPMVGTFYSRANPNAKNYVEVGATVQTDSVVCIIEAMKVFNEIPAEVRGKIVAVLVQNEEAVDFGKPLFKVDTRG